MEEADSNEEEEDGAGGGSKVSDQQQKELRKKRIYTPLNVSKKNNKRSKSSSSSSSSFTPTPTIHNIVSTSKIVCISPGDMQERSVDLDEVFELIHCSHYNRKKFAAITIRIDDPTVTALLFTSGRLVITGSKSWYECMLASLVIVGMLRKVQPSCHLEVRDCEIQNVVANVIIPGSTPEIPLDARLNINAMLVHLNASVKEPVCQYRKHLFPGLVYRPPDSPVVVLCFISGKCVITGGRTMDDVNVGWSLLWDNIKKFIIDKDGRAILDGGHILNPPLLIN